jgi:hypothetical protein
MSVNNKKNLGKKEEEQPTAQQIMEASMRAQLDGSEMTGTQAKFIGAYSGTGQKIAAGTLISSTSKTRTVPSVAAGRFSRKREWSLFP